MKRIHQRVINCMTYYWLEGDWVALLNMFLVLPVTYFAMHCYSCTVSEEENQWNSVY